MVDYFLSNFPGRHATDCFRPHTFWTQEGRVILAPFNFFSGVKSSITADITYNRRASLGLGVVCVCYTCLACTFSPRLPALPCRTIKLMTSIACIVSRVGDFCPPVPRGSGQGRSHPPVEKSRFGPHGRVVRNVLGPKQLHTSFITHCTTA